MRLRALLTPNENMGRPGLQFLQTHVKHRETAAFSRLTTPGSTCSKYSLKKPIREFISKNKAAARDLQKAMLLAFDYAKVVF